MQAQLSDGPTIAEAHFDITESQWRLVSFVILLAPAAPHCAANSSHFETSKNSLSHERGSERSERSEQTSERSGWRERSEQSGASKRVSSVSEQANG